MKAMTAREVRIVHPLDDAHLRAQAARLSAATRKNVRRLFPEGDEAYMRAFSELKPDQAIAAVDDGKVVAVRLFWTRGSDPHVLSLAQFRALWGPIRGVWLWVVYNLHERAQSGWDTYGCALWVEPEYRRGDLGKRMIRRTREVYDGYLYGLGRPEALEFLYSVGYERRLYPRGVILGWISNTTPVRLKSLKPPQGAVGEAR